MVGDCRRQVGLAAAVTAQQQQPTLHRAGKLDRHAVRILKRVALDLFQPHSALRVKGFKGFIAKCRQVAALPQPFQDDILSSVLAADTNQQTTKIGVVNR